MNTETRERLLQALHGEAFAFARYLLFAEAARRNGRSALADLFERTAHAERFEHFAEEAELAGLVRSDEDNLREAIAGERYEVETMYPDFAQQAQLAGEAAAAERFAEIRDDESDHLATFERALEQLEQGAMDILHEQTGAGR
jgi:rubrerythrin